MHKILIVEDEETLREAYVLILSTEPYLVSAAGDGEMALKLCEKTVFDLILLDLMMPKIDGVGFLENYPQRIGSPLPPVILLSNLSSGDQLLRALSLGARKNVIKADVSPKQLIALVHNELKSA